MTQFSLISYSVRSLAVILMVAANASAAEWGSLKGRFVVDGTPAARPALVLGTDQFCIGHKPTDRTVLVGEKGALANVAVTLFVARGQTVESHPDYSELAKKAIELDNKNCAFEPHVTLLRTNQPLVLKNSDAVAHNTNLANQFNEIISVGSQSTKTITTAPATPIQVTCNIHPFMKGVVIVQDHPYMAVSNDKGEFEIKNIPAGSRSFAFWHEAPGNLRDLKIGAVTTDRRGRADLAIKAGETLDLGEIKISAALLK
jgi:plastocyanin